MPFCFSITDFTKNSDGVTVYYYAKNVAEKEAWTEAIQASIFLIHIAAAKKRKIQKLASSSRDHSSSFDSDDAKALLSQKNQYSARPLIYIKIVQIRNVALLFKSIDIYVKVTMGLSTVETTTRTYPVVSDWGMVFPFDWDRSMRIAKVEVFCLENSSAQPDLLGMVQIPIASLTEGVLEYTYSPIPIPLFLFPIPLPMIVLLYDCSLTSLCLFKGTRALDGTPSATP